MCVCSCGHVIDLVRLEAQRSFDQFLNSWLCSMSSSTVFLFQLNCLNSNWKPIPYFKYCCWLVTHLYCHGSKNLIIFIVNNISPWLTLHPVFKNNYCLVEMWWKHTSSLLFFRVKYTAMNSLMTYCKWPTETPGSTTADDQLACIFCIYTL